MHAGHHAKCTGGGGLIPVEEWVEMFKNCWGKSPKYAHDTEAILATLATRMAKTDPMEAFEFNRGAVAESNIVNAWAAACEIYGAPWKDREEWVTKTPADKRKASAKIISWSPMMSVITGTSMEINMVPMEDDQGNKDEGKKTGAKGKIMANLYYPSWNAKDDKQGQNV